MCFFLKNKVTRMMRVEAPRQFLTPLAGPRAERAGREGRSK